MHCINANLGNAYSVLYGLLSSRVSSIDGPKGCVVPFLKRYSSGGLIGFYTKGTPQEAATYLAKAVGELRAIADSPEGVEAIKTKVSKW